MGFNFEDNSVLNNIIEEWRPVVEFPDRYEVSNLGRVRSIEKKFFHKIKSQHQTTTSNYLYVAISVNNKTVSRSVHRMVAEAFIPNPLNKEQVNHKDSNRHNNHVDNLEWVTRSENIQHGRKYGNISDKHSIGVKSNKASSRFHNVFWNEKQQRWQPSVKLNGRRLSQKCFKDEIECAKFVNQLLLEHGITDRPFNNV